MLDESTFAALFLVVALAMLFGFLGGTFRSLTIHRLLQGLHWRVNDIEERLTREDRRAGGIERWNKQREKDTLLESAMEAVKKKAEQKDEAPTWQLFGS